MEKLVEDAEEAINRRQFGKAITLLDQIIIKAPDNSWNYYYKARILRQVNRSIEALNVIELGLLYCGDTPNLLVEKAELLISIPQKVSDIDLAISLLDKAQNTYNGNINQHRVNMELKESSINELITIMDSKIKFFDYIREWKTSAQNLRSGFILYSEIENAKKEQSSFIKNMKKQKTNIVELLGLFTALMAFIFLTVQISISLDIKSSFKLITLLGLILLNFSLSLSYFTDSFSSGRWWKKILDIRVGIFMVSVAFYIALYISVVK